ncbi:hypothetical protein [Hellea balneolensis]|uniref:hypothetical protein n=1 Tax=Hellea balneolensis TaxID=287478 RepID=UPI0003F54704|nr:hypothetical protein [Hellea balneolensis]
MPGKIIDANNNVLFEFSEGQSVAILLSGLVTRAKFGDKFDNDLLANPWVNELLKSLIDAEPGYSPVSGNEMDFGAPDYYLKEGFTQQDWNLKDFFREITLHLSNSAHLLSREGWKTMNTTARSKFLRSVVFPQPISNMRIQDMIEDIDGALEASASVYNPDYKP